VWGKMRKENRERVRRDKGQDPNTYGNGKRQVYSDINCLGTLSVRSGGGRDAQLETHIQHPFVHRLREIKSDVRKFQASKH